MTCITKLYLFSGGNLTGICFLQAEAAFAAKDFLRAASFYAKVVIFHLEFLC